VEPTNVYCLCSLAKVERLSGHRSAARELLEQALEQEPSNRECLQEMDAITQAVERLAQAKALGARRSKP